MTHGTGLVIDEAMEDALLDVRYIILLKAFKLINPCLNL